MPKSAPRRNAMISAKIEKVHKDHPEKSHKQVVGMAMGILAGEGKIRKRPK